MQTHNTNTAHEAQVQVQGSRGRQVGATVSAEHYAIIERMAKQDKRSVSNLVSIMIEDFLERLTQAQSTNILGN
jgi:hypothetical protein